MKSPGNALFKPDNYRVNTSIPSGVRSLALALCLAFVAGSGASAGTLETLTDTSWITNSSQKYGFVIALTTSQALTGLVESAKYNGHYIVSSDGDTYHAFRFAQDVSWLATGYLGASVLKNKHWRWYEKGGILIAGGLIGNSGYEWMYKANRYGNPFDYNPEHNRKAIVYIGIRNGHLTDLYLGTGYFTGPVVDIMRIAGAAWLLGKID